MTEPAVGQLWKDWDSRIRGNSDMDRVYRIQRIEGDYAYMTLVRHGARVYKPRPITRVRLSRLRPNSTGYLLVCPTA